ncbi:hypothetical protein [Herbaspirillum chlorophenolicum]|uniref:hypothetical protein n=1 Tax=Herbaspirillum chlorophenolicum TaxID=211589 RepID=UPI000B209657|nr:hypothetical protein [Herbaspirillum chlorophenolicum]
MFPTTSRKTSFDPIPDSSPPTSQAQAKQVVVPTASSGTVRGPENSGRVFVQTKLAEKNLHSPHRSKPFLANSVNLCRETGLLLSKPRLSSETPTVIATTYGDRGTHSRAANVAANLVLDLNLMFEEKLQHAIEHEPHFTAELKKIIELIHKQLDIESIVLPPDAPLGKEHRSSRLDFLFNKFQNYFPLEPLKRLFEERDGSDSTITAFLAKHPISKDVDETEKASVIGYMKLLKMLFGQFPYFGGSVEYKQGIENSMEYWIYHLSTITRDPDRSIPIGKNCYGHLLLKPLADYRTRESGLVPLMNQRNLGTGVAEAEWNELSKAMKKSLENGVYQFREKRLPERSGKHIQDEKYSRKFNKLMSGIAKETGKPSDQLSIEEIWTAANEDERKFLYGDIAEIPWSDAHLHGGESFEQTYNTHINAEELDYRHPLVTSEREVGLMNVAGVHGNILEKPEVACEKYIKEIRRKLNIPRDSAEFHIRDSEFGIHYSSDFLKRDFISKQKDWYDSAYNNQRPIVGGMSGHTLGYLNLYCAAVDKWAAQRKEQKDQPIPFPSLETFRAILLAALVGNKRHHSYDEVMAASVGMKFATDQGPGLTYKDRVGYRDIFQSSDPALQQCARHAAAEVDQVYLALEYDTVLSAIELNQSGLRKNLEEPVKQYFQALRSGDADQIVEAKIEIEEKINDL